MQFVTDFADEAVILPLLLASVLGFAMAGWGRGALAWLAAGGATLGVVAAAKIAVFVYGPPGLMPDLLSPSGHTAAAGLVYGGLAGLLLFRGGVRTVALAACLFILPIAVTRVVLDVHTLPDVLVGAVIGLAGALGLAACAGPRPAHVQRIVPVGLGVAVLLGFHGLRMPAEPWLHSVAAALMVH